MMLALSAYSVETEPRGFAQCAWPATSATKAEEIAKELSVRLASYPAYVNAFWVVDARNRPVCKFLRGERFSATAVI